MTGIGKAKLINNFVDLHVGKTQPGFNQFQFVRCDIILQALPRLTFKIFADVGGRNIEMRSDNFIF